MNAILWMVPDFPAHNYKFPDAHANETRRLMPNYGH